MSEDGVKYGNEIWIPDVLNSSSKSTASSLTRSTATVHFTNSSVTLLINSIDINPTTRHTVWSFVFGGWFYWFNFLGVDQTVVQRFMALPDLKTARK